MIGGIHGVARVHPAYSLGGPITHRIVSDMIKSTAGPALPRWPSPDSPALWRGGCSVPVNG
jgi:hypothetical protein